MPKLAFALMIGSLAAFPGCLSRQFARDGIQLRQALLDMYTDQTMDNLIRARSNMPFVQLKYSTIQANDAQDTNISGATDQMLQNAMAFATGALTRTATHDYKITPSFDRKRVMNFTCDPITDQNDVYQKYIAFANDTGLFVVDRCPPSHPVHICRKCGDLYYWVPTEAGPAFLDLCMKTTFMRGKAENSAAGYVEVKIADVELDSTDTEGPEILINAFVDLDKAVPNGSATLMVDLGNQKTMRLTLYSVDPGPKNPVVVPIGQPTKRFTTQWSKSKYDVEPDSLKSKSARFYSHDFPPDAPPATPYAEQINNNLNSIKTQIQMQSRSGN